VKLLSATAGIDKCAICEQVVSFAESALANNATQQEIEKVVNQLCTVIDNSPLKQFGPICHSIASNIPMLIELIESEVSPDVVCGLLKFCPAMEIVRSVSPQLPTIDKCTICEQVVQFAETALLNNATEQEIANVVDKLCTVIDNSPLKQFGPICHDIASNIPVLVALLEQQLPPAQICALLKFCTSGSRITERGTLEIVTQLGVDNCDMCKEIVALVEFEIEQNKTLTQVIALAHEVCDAIEKTPLKPLAAMCNAVADALPDIIPQLVNQLPPDQVCADLGQCTAKGVTHRLR